MGGSVIGIGHDKWVHVTMVRRVLRLWMEEGPPVWRVAANILNKQSQTAKMCGPPTWGLGEVLTSLRRKKKKYLVMNHSQLPQFFVTGSCECCNEPSASRQSGEFLD